MRRRHPSEDMRGSRILRAGRRAVLGAALCSGVALAWAPAAGAQGVEPPARPGSPPAVVAPLQGLALQVVVRDGVGGERRATLRCRGDAVDATGFLAADPERACVDARRLAGFLTSRPARLRFCIDLYGGPQTARVAGHVGVRSIDRRFSRRNGCAIEDWNRVAPLLGEARPPAPPVPPATRPELVEYRRSGGIAGFDDRLTVYRDGSATLERVRGSSGRYRVGAEDLRALEQALEAARFPELRPEYLPDTPIADGFGHTITYRGRTVRTADGGVPARLEPVLRALSEPSPRRRSAPVETRPYRDRAR